MSQRTAMTPMLAEAIHLLNSPCLVHPTTMDTGVQEILIAAHKGSLQDFSRSFIPVGVEDNSIKAIQIFRDLNRCRSNAPFNEAERSATLAVGSIIDRTTAVDEKKFDLVI